MKAASLYPLLLAFSVAVRAENTPTPKDTGAPNQFWFSSSEYLVTESETNLVITVEWIAGNRGFTGWVDYFATNGTATVGSDFTPVSGRLYFNSPAWQNFSIPIHADSFVEGEETIQLVIANPDAILLTSNAVVKIQDVQPLPKIDIAHGANNSIVLSWPGEPSEFALETSASAGATWAEVPVPQSLVNGKSQVTLACNGQLALFRLKKSNP